MINLHIFVVLVVFCMVTYEAIYTYLVLKREIAKESRFHMQVHLKYLLTAIPLLIWLEIKLLSDGDILMPVTFFLVWLGGVMHHLHTESRATKKGERGLDIRGDWKNREDYEDYIRC